MAIWALWGGTRVVKVRKIHGCADESVERWASRWSWQRSDRGRAGGRVRSGSEHVRGGFDPGPLSTPIRTASGLMVFVCCEPLFQRKLHSQVRHRIFSHSWQNSFQKSDPVKGESCSSPHTTPHGRYSPPVPAPPLPLPGSVLRRGVRAELRAGFFIHVNSSSLWERGWGFPPLPPPRKEGRYPGPFRPPPNTPVRREFHS